VKRIASSSTAWGLLSIWAAITGFQVVHEFQHEFFHHPAHGAEPHHPHHCDGHGHASALDGEKPSIVPEDHACLICDWEWAPADPADGFNFASSLPEWMAIRAIGTAQSGVAQIGHCSANTLRGPPLKG